MNKFQAVVEELGRMDQNRIRNDNSLCTQVDKIRYVQQSLEENAKKLTEMVYQIQDNIDQSVQQCQQKAETMMR